jgi:hypothetical protein
MDKATATAIGKATEEALQSVAAQFGLTVKVKGGKYDPAAGTYVPKVEYAAHDTAEREWKRYADMFGLEADDFGKRFYLRGELYRIVGLNFSAKKYPVLAMRTVDGKVFKFPAQSIKQHLAERIPV